MKKAEEIVVLVVEDEEELREAIGYEVEGYGYQILTASDGQEALEILSQKKVDLILSDIRMPNCDGINMIKRLREDLNSKVPLIFISGFSAVSVEQILALGAEEIFPKPFDRKLLKARIERALKATEERVQPLELSVPIQEDTLRYSMGETVKIAGAIQVGIGGIQVFVGGLLPRVGEVIDFHGQTQEGRNLSGRGIVKWVRGADALKNMQAAVGLEISHFVGNQFDEAIALMKASKTNSYIPNL